MLQEEQKLSNHIKLHKYPRSGHKEDEEEKMSPEDPETKKASRRGNSRGSRKVSFRRSSSLNGSPKIKWVYTIRRDYFYKLLLRDIRHLMGHHFDEK